MKNKYDQEAVHPPKYILFPTAIAASVNQALGGGAPRMVWLRDGGLMFVLREVA